MFQVMSLLKMEFSKINSTSMIRKKGTEKFRENSKRKYSHMEKYKEGDKRKTINYSLRI